MSSSAFINNIVDIILTTSSDDEAGLPNRQHGEESEDRGYKSSELNLRNKCLTTYYCKGLTFILAVNCLQYCNDVISLAAIFSKSVTTSCKPLFSLIQHRLIFSV